jgi:hypothetical protein
MTSPLASDALQRKPSAAALPARPGTYREYGGVSCLLVTADGGSPQWRWSDLVVASVLLALSVGDRLGDVLRVGAIVLGILLALMFAGLAEEYGPIIIMLLLVAALCVAPVLLVVWVITGWP